MIQEIVKQTIQKHGLFQRGDKVLVACSGGADSVVLLHILLSLQSERSLELFVGHFNHKLRSEAAGDAEFVRRLAGSHSLPFHKGSQDVSAWAKKRGVNLEEAGRELRYRFLKRTAARLGCQKIATGHTMTDQAETFFMRLIRGSGMRGLAGIFPTIEGVIVRPLIQVEREEVEAYLLENQLEFRTDRSNFDKRYLRNRIRMEFLPFIRNRFDENIVAHIGKLADVLQEEDAVLESLAQDETVSAVTGRGDEVKLDCQSLKRLPLALQRRVVRMFISRLKGDVRGMSFEDVESVLRMGEGKQLHLKKDLILQKQRGIICLWKMRQPEIAYEYTWDIRKELFVRELNLRFWGKITVRKAASSLVFNDNKTAHLDADRLHFPLTVRSRRQGDRYRPLGAPGNQRLKEIMRAKGIEPEKRACHPVFLSGGEIVWIQGLPVSDMYKVTESTKKLFKIEVFSPGK